MNEIQKLNITIVFKEKHSPGSDLHLHEVVMNYLKGKGVELAEGNEVYI